MGGQGEWEEVAEEPQEEYEETPEEAAPEEEVEYEEAEPSPPPWGPARSATRPDRSVLAMVSGLGFFVAVLLMIFGVWGVAGTSPAGAVTFTGLTVAGLGLATVIPYLWMLDDLRIRPRRIKKSHARFMSGPLIGILAIVLFGLFSLSGGNWLLAILAVVVIGITQASVTLFLYSMLWED